MALEKVDTDENFSGVNGVFVGQDAPMFLGIKDLSVAIKDEFGTADIVVGFDTRIQPAQVRVFYDKNFEDTGTVPDKHYGLMMTREICFDGLPIQPSVFSSALAFQDFYSNFVKNTMFPASPISPAYVVDMLAPDLLVDNDIKDPFFAFNAVATAQEFTKADAFKLNDLNGFLAYSKDVTEDDAPLCPALFAPLGIDIDGPFLSEIMAFIEYQKREGVEAAGEFEISAAEISQGLLLDKVLDIGDTPIPIEEVIDMKMVGDYMVIVLDDPENYFPVLIADPNKGEVYMYDIDVLEAAHDISTRNLFDRFTDFAAKDSRSNVDFPNLFHFGDSYTLKDQVAKMRSGGTHKVTCNYRVYSVEKWTVPGSEDQAHHCMGGVKFSTSRTFDKDQLRFGPIDISTPEPLGLQNVIDFNQEIFSIYQNEKLGTMPELANYFEALDSGIQASVDAIQWSRTYPPLPTDILPAQR